MFDKNQMVSPDNALPGRQDAMPVPEFHYVLNTPLIETYPDEYKSRGFQQAIFGLGCFWGAERKFWTLDGVYSTAVGYAGGFTPNPTYQEVCSGQTGHNEVVKVVYDPQKIDYQSLLILFWESHNPTQGMRQGNDRGTQYRSSIFTYDNEQALLATQSLQKYQQSLEKAGYSKITTEIVSVPQFYFAEDYHQQYLAKNPSGYCGLGGTGISYKQPIL